MKRTASLLLVALAGSAQAAGFENMLNPLGGLSPFGSSNPFAPSPFAGTPFGYGASPFGYGASPFGMGSPFGLGSPLGLGSPFGLGSPLGLGAVAVPLGLGLLNPLGGMGMGNAMYPALQMAPNMMSYQHMNQMANPYAGGPFAGNPYLQPSMPNPFSAPAFSPSMPTMPTMPFAAPQQQGNLSGMLPLPQFGYGAMVPVAPAVTPSMGRTPWSQPQAVPVPQAPAPSAMPFLMPFLTPPPAQAAPVPAPAPAATPSLMPFFPAAPQPVQAQAKPAPAPEKAPEKAAPAAQPPANNTPLDPAAFMQMFMKPAESAK